MISRIDGLDGIISGKGIIFGWKCWWNMWFCDVVIMFDIRYLVYFDCYLILVILNDVIFDKIGVGICSVIWFKEFFFEIKEG